MGVDAEMAFTATEELDEARIRNMQFHLLHRVGKEFFFRYNHDTGEASKFFIHRAKEFQLDSDDVIRGEFLYRLGLYTRYYGPDYERGDALKLCAVMLWLNAQPDVRAVYYGGDSSGGTPEKFDNEKVLSLLGHFTCHGRLPYLHYFDRNERTPKCPHCWEPMWHYGSGNNYWAFQCLGCEFVILNENGITTEYETREQAETARDAKWKAMREAGA